MNIPRFAACTLFCVFATSRVDATKDSDVIKEAEKALLQDWTNRDNVILHLIDRVGFLEKSVGECDKRLKNFDNEMKEIDKDTKTISTRVVQQGIAVTRCCSGGHAPKERTLTVDVDDRITLYLDGREIKGFQHATDWRTADSVKLPSNTKVIAVKGLNEFGDPGVLASTEDGYVLTNETWKCSNKKDKGWATIGFDDSKWPPAYSVLPATRKPIAGIRNDTSWIWTKNFKYLKGDKEAYCRIKLP